MSSSPSSPQIIYVPQPVAAQQDLNAASTPTATPQLPDSGVQNAAQQQVANAQQASGSGSTIKTSPQGIVQPASTTNTGLQPAAQAYGAAQTILTGPQGLSEQAKTTNKTLLGG